MKKISREKNSQKVFEDYCEDFVVIFGQGIQRPES